MVSDIIRISLEFFTGIAAGSLSRLPLFCPPSPAGPRVFPPGTAPALPLLSLRERGFFYIIPQVSISLRIPAYPEWQLPGPFLERRAGISGIVIV